MTTINNLTACLEREYPRSDEYIQAAREIVSDVIDVYHVHDEYKKHRVLERILRPERIIHFKVEWENDAGEVQFNPGWRVQHCQLLGPYKGGLRFHPSVNQSILQFLALEQAIKNALTGESLGAGKGGANFDAKQHSENEIRRFSRAFIRELSHNIGEDVDIPAGDIGVSSREIAWMNGYLLSQKRNFNASLTGKPTFFSGSHLREQATGFGVIYLLLNILKDLDRNIEDTVVAVSGAGNVGLHAAKKAIEAGAKVISLSNSRGLLHAENGFDIADIDKLIDGEIKASNELEEIAQSTSYEYIEDAKPWGLKADIFVPCATQNEINEDDAKKIAKNDNAIVIEGANMPSDDDAISVYHSADVLHIPGKAANAGGVILSSFEIQQQISRIYHTEEALDQRLKQSMFCIHQKCLEEMKKSKLTFKDYAKAASRVGFRRLADAMVAAAY